MTYHHTFPIGTLTLGLTRFFHSPLFPLGVTLIVFLSYFVFPLNNKTKINSNSKNNFQIKNESRHLSGDA